MLLPLRLILVLTSILCFTVPSVAQRHFYFEEPFTREAKIPNAVVPLLRDVITDSCRGQISTNGIDVRSWFYASRIDLKSRRSAFIVRSGHHRCLTGVDNAWFWIFLKTGRSYELVLASGTISLDVLKTVTRGLRDIETNAATAATNYTNVFKFDGRVYKRHRCLQASPPDAKPKRVACRT